MDFVKQIWQYLSTLLWEDWYDKDIWYISGVFLSSAGY